MDRENVISWVEGLAEDDWRLFHSDSEVQNIAKAVLALLKEQEEKLKFLDALYNYINPNDMEKYMQMYKSLPIPSDGRSVKWE